MSGLLAWPSCHRNELTRALVPRARPVPRDVEFRYVLAATPRKGLVHAAADATMRSIHPDILWRAMVIDDWDALGSPRTLTTPRLRWAGEPGEPLPAELPT